MRFREIPGNNEIKNKLIRTVLDQRVSHAQLFYGPVESNKLALAIAYAQFINCTAKTGMTDPASEISAVASDSGGGISAFDSCGVCPSCVKYQKLAHPDLHFIYPVASTKRITGKVMSKYFIEDWRSFLQETNYNAGLQNWYEKIGIENKQGIINVLDCNEIITTLSYKSYESDYKVMIIWMVERLYYAAAPKILKILEEPPDKTLFILISEEPDQIIKTILSRTLMVRIPTDTSVTRMLHQDDSVHFTQFRQWMRECYGAKIPDLIRTSAELARPGREKQKSFLLYALKTIGHCATFNYLGKIAEEVEGDELKFIQNFAPFIHSDILHDFNSLLNDAIYHVERNAHSGTLFLNLSLKIVRLFKPNFVSLSG